MSAMEQRVRDRLLAIELERSRRVRAIRRNIERGVPVDASARLRTRRGFGILRAERLRLEAWLDSRS